MSGHSSSGSHCRADQMRAPPRPWRPSKLRLLVEAQRSPDSGDRCSSPDTLSNLASAIQTGFNKDFVQTFRFRLGFYRAEPGTTSACTPGATFRPLAIQPPRVNLQYAS